MRLDGATLKVQVVPYHFPTPCAVSLPLPGPPLVIPTHRGAPGCSGAVVCCRVAPLCPRSGPTGVSPGPLYPGAFGPPSGSILSLPMTEREGRIWNERAAHRMMENCKSNSSSKSCGCKGTSAGSQQVPGCLAAPSGYGSACADVAHSQRNLSLATVSGLAAVSPCPQACPARPRPLSLDAPTTSRTVTGLGVAPRSGSESRLRRK